MITKEEIYNSLNREVNELDEKISNFKLYNFKNFFKRTAIGTTLSLNRFLPFAIASILISSTSVMGYKKPFNRDMIIESAQVATVDTSTGYHLETTSFDYTYASNSLEYTTGWQVDENNNYSRTITTYEIDDSIDLKDLDSVLTKTKEELQNSLHITNIKTITKTKLTDDDELFFEPAVIVTRSFTSEDKTIERKETAGEDIWFTICYIGFTTLVGTGINSVKNIIFKKRLENKLKGLMAKYRRIDRSEIESLKRVLEIKKANLELMSSSATLEDAPAPRKAR